MPCMALDNGCFNVMVITFQKKECRINYVNQILKDLTPDLT